MIKGLRERIQAVLLGWCISMCHNCRGLKFSVLSAQNLTRENIIAAGCFADFSLVMLCFHTAQDWKSLIK
jgi:hypothetical protein